MWKNLGTKRKEGAGGLDKRGPLQVRLATAGRLWLGDCWSVSSCPVGDRWLLDSPATSGRREGGCGPRQVATSGRPLTVGRRLCRQCAAFLIFFFLELIFFLLFKGYKGPGRFGGCVHSSPIFWSLPLHLEVLNLPSLMDFEDFILFSNFIFPKFRVHSDLHIYHWDFCFMKNWDH
jgi:hypothetical protein